MSRCVDPKVGDLLHAWELDLLSEEQNREVEIHLIECPACQEAASDFSKAATLLRESQVVQNEAKKADRKIFPVFMRSLLAAVIILGIGLPAYMYWSTPADLEPGQQLIFYPTRTAGERTMNLATEGGVEFVFLAPESQPGSKFTVVIESGEGTEVFRSDSFDDINEQGAGSVALPTDLFSTGLFKLHIITQDFDTTTYGFRAE